jgi:hypothetical protein
VRRKAWDGREWSWTEKALLNFRLICIWEAVVSKKPLVNWNIGFWNLKMSCLLDRLIPSTD